MFSGRSSWTLLRCGLAQLENLAARSCAPQVLHCARKPTICTSAANTAKRCEQLDSEQAVVCFCEYHRSLVHNKIHRQQIGGIFQLLHLTQCFTSPSCRRFSQTLVIWMQGRVNSALWVQPEAQVSESLGISITKKSNHNIFTPCVACRLFI